MRLSRHPDTFDAERSMAVAAEAADSLRALGDELGLARAEFLMCDLTWLLGDPAASFGHAEEMLALARRAGSEFDAALRSRSWPGASSRARGRCPRRSLAARR